MNFEPFYVSTAGLTVQDVSNLWSYTVDHGANICFNNPKCALLASYVGVDYEGDTMYGDSPRSFGESSIQLNYNEVLDHVQGSYRITEEDDENLFPVSDIAPEDLDEALLLEVIDLRLPKWMVIELEGLSENQGISSYKTLIRRLIKDYLDNRDR